MVTKQTWEESRSYWKINFKFVPAFDLNKCLNLITLPISLFMCTSFFETTGVKIRGKCNLGYVCSLTEKTPFLYRYFEALRWKISGQDKSNFFADFF